MNATAHRRARRRAALSCRVPVTARAYGPAACSMLPPEYDAADPVLERVALIFTATGVVSAALV